LVGVSVEEAGRRLEAAGLALGTVSSEKDETVATGLVLSVATVDEAVPQGSEVDLVVSGGPLPRVVPKGLVGLMPADVVAELIALRLAPTMGEEHDEWMAAGRVSRIEPVGGTRIQVNDDVRVVVSLGAEPRSVPSLEGLSLVAAESRLAASGFRTVVVEGLTDGEVVDRTLLVVVSQTPPAGRREMPATTVTLVVRPA
ncbi:MAG: PASTA domain-containing protein, partial [Actinomycetota bacterium]|nr:PASTA domain-containing protein [Actinomycetota bacterium]